MKEEISKRPRSRRGPYCIEEERTTIFLTDEDENVITELVPSDTFRVVSRRGNLIIARHLTKFGALRGMLMMNGAATETRLLAQGYRR